MQRKKYGYMGSNSALNGLTHWLQDHIVLMKGTSDHKYNQCMNIIVAYAVANIPNYIKRGHAHVQAEHIAKKIQTFNKWKEFTAWVKSNYEWVHTINY